MKMDKNDSEMLNKIYKLIIELSSKKSINNNAFNVNFFLNETCNNITYFVSNIKVELKDLENT